MDKFPKTRIDEWTAGGGGLSYPDDVIGAIVGDEMYSNEVIDETIGDRESEDLERLRVLEDALRELLTGGQAMWGDLELAQFLDSRGLPIEKYAPWWKEHYRSAPWK